MRISHGKMCLNTHRKTFRALGKCCNYKLPNRLISLFLWMSSSWEKMLIRLQNQLFFVHFAVFVSRSFARSIQSATITTKKPGSTEFIASVCSNSAAQLSNFSSRAMFVSFFISLAISHESRCRCEPSQARLFSIPVARFFFIHLCQL